MTKELFHKHFIAQDFEDSCIMVVFSKCGLKNTSPIYLLKPVFLPDAIALLWSDLTDFILQRNLVCCQTCSFVQKALFRFSSLAFLFSL